MKAKISFGLYDGCPCKYVYVNGIEVGEICKLSLLDRTNRQENQMEEYEVEVVLMQTNWVLYVARNTKTAEKWCQKIFASPQLLENEIDKYLRNLLCKIYSPGENK